MTVRMLALLAVLTLAPFVADAQSYRCVGADGKRYYSSTIPDECYGKPVEQLNAQGSLVRRIDPDGSERERLAKQAVDARKREQDAAARAVARRNRALLATYTSEKDIDDARGRALAENSQAIRDAEARIGAIRKLQSEYDNELEFYQGKNQPPAKLREDIKTAAEDLKVQLQILEAKKRDVEIINARYDDDKKRYAELTRSR